MAADDSHLIEKRLGGRVLLSGGFLEVHKDDVELPDGGTATREYIHHDGAVAVVPLLDDSPDPRLVLVRQFRHPTGRILLELPAGKRDRDEEQLVCAQRELAEETGYVAGEWAFAGEFFNAPAYSTEMIWIWLARGLQPGPARPDAGEFVETVTMRLSELAALHDRGELPDVKTQLALHWLLRAQATGRVWHWHGAEMPRPL